MHIKSSTRNRLTLTQPQAFRPGLSAAATIPGHLRFATLTSLLIGAMSIGVMSAGCTTGQIGGEVGADENDGTDSCEVVGTNSVVGSETTNLGFSANEIIDQVVGTHQTGLAWAQSESLDELMVTPEAGESAVTLDIVVDDSSARLLDREPRSIVGDGEGLTTASAYCPDTLAFDAAVTITSENGAFDDTFEVTFFARSSLLATATIELHPEQTAGRFDVVPKDDDGDTTVSSQLQLAIAAGAPSGKIVANVETETEDAIAQAQLIVGTFPDQEEDGCDQGYLLDSDSPTVQAARSAVASLSDFTMTYSDDSSTALTLSHDLGVACLRTNDAESRIAFKTVTAAQAEDGSIDGTWQLDASVTFAGLEEPHQVEVFRHDYLLNTYAPGTFAEQSGITAIGIDEDLEGSFSFSVSDELDDDISATGELTVMEITPVNCNETQDGEQGSGSSGAASGADGGADPLAPPEEGGGGGGCHGDSIVREVGGATLAAP